MSKSEKMPVPKTSRRQEKLRAIAEQQKRILGNFTPEEQEIITRKQKQLAALGYFIGKDFSIPIILNEEGGGAHWNAEDNIIRIDARDMLERPLEYLRYVYSHEAGHRRIDRLDLIPMELRKQHGFMSMCHTVFDPRNNNFVAEAYPGYMKQLELVYAERIPKWEKAREEMIEKRGYVPRHSEITSELYRNWWNDINGKPIAFNPAIGSELITVLNSILPFAQDAWWRYPSKEEADTGEAVIREYAAKAYSNFTEHMWPVFQPLVREDIRDEKIQYLMEHIVSGAFGVPGETPAELSAMLAEPDAKEVEAALQAAISQKKPVNPQLFSPTAREALEKFTESLTEKMQQELQEVLKQMLQELDELLQGEMESMMEAERTDMETSVESEDSAPGDTSASEEASEEGRPSARSHVGTESKEIGRTKEGDEEGEYPASDDHGEQDKRIAEEMMQNKLGELSKDANVYEHNMREVLPIIQQLESDLRELFVHRRSHAWKSGFKFGKKLDIKRRVQEKAKGVSAFESRAWQRREAPGPKDYAITLLVDLSGSMQGQNIAETFKAVVALAEALNMLSISVEILGFNDRIYEYQRFDESMTDAVRAHMGGMLKEVTIRGTFGIPTNAAYNDDGWALSEASKRLAKRSEAIKIIIPLSDGTPEPSRAHSGPQYDLEKVVSRITQESNQKIIGLGIGERTGHVSYYYPNSLANVPVDKMAEKLTELIRTVIEDPDSF